MTPKEKAEEIVNSIWIKASWATQKNAVVMAVILVDEIIKTEPLNPHDGTYYETIQDRVDSVKEYWKQVKSEIELLC